MALRATYKNICPEVTGKPLSVISPTACGNGRHKTPGLPRHLGATIMELSPEKTCNMYHITFRKKNMFYNIFS